MAKLYMKTHPNSVPGAMPDPERAAKARAAVEALVSKIKPLVVPKIDPSDTIRERQYRALIKMSNQLAEGFERLSKIIIEQKAAETVLPPRQDFGPTLQELVANISAGLGSVKDAVNNKPVPTWRFPQYLQTGVRDTQFKPINPSIDPYGIGMFDQTVLAYTGSNLTSVIYKLAGDTVATLTLTYDLSDNLIGVVKS